MNDARVLDDRRKQSMAFLSRQGLVCGRRKTIRRRADRKKYIFLDSYGSRLFTMLLLLLVLSISDAYLTLILVKIYGGVELNPIMAVYLEYGSIPFFVQKFLFTSAAVFVFCVLNGVAAVRIALILAIMLYSGTVFYELSVLHYLSGSLYNIVPF
jgi:hypothetical protein